MSKNIKSIKFNFIMNFILTVSNFLFPLITFPYVSRVLLPEGTGKVAFALSIVSYFTIFASFGVATYGIRAIAQVRDDKERLSKTMHELLFINIISMTIVYVALAIAILVVPKFAMEKELFWVTSLFILFTIVGVEWLYKGLEKYQYITIRTIIFKIASLFLVFLFVKEKSDYIIFAFISIFAIVGSGVLNLINSRKLINYTLYSEYEFKKHLKPMFVLFLTSMAIAIYTSLDEGLLGLLSSPEQVGYYNAAVRVKGILFTLITSLGVVLLPRLSYYVENHMETEFHEALAKSTNFIIVIAASVVIFFTLFAKETILILAGENYVASIIPLQIVVWALILSAITNILGIQILLPLKKDKQLLFSVLCAATVDVIANFLLVPKLAAVGTALSVIAAELSVLIVQIIILRQYIKILFSGLQLHKIIIALLIAIACALFVREIVVNTSTLIIFLCSSSVFFLAYFIILLLLKEKFIMYVYHTIYTKFIAYRR
ncbi:flippase [uncultured Haemophilus sp.]|uniref:flippase n=1 Tax=uncultured Haemophilus sp. TaxID=237779 RepID=UPI0028062393|nr:flippase [uncultured Haemophilus sp.]MDU6706764.1 flippase [Haemophilus parainfluenzae]